MYRKKSTVVISAILLLAISGSAFMVISNNGIANQTGSPGEATCSSCHGGGSSASSGVSITAVPSFSNNEYEPGTTYTITIDVIAAGFNKFGFGCEILKMNNTNAGLMQAAGTGVKFINTTRKNAVHSTPKTGSGMGSFTFQWVAPQLDTLTMYVAGNAVNGNGSTSGDFPLSPVSLHLFPKLPVDPVGIKEQTAFKSTVDVYPNPAKDLIRLTYNLFSQQQVEIQITELNGKLIQSYSPETQSQGVYNKTLALDNLAPGVYFIKLNGNQKQLSQKLLIVE
jgi:hypothetical protein